MGKLDNKVAIITGASGGIGRVAAVLFADEGAKVVIASRKAMSGEETAKMIQQKGGEATFIAADISKSVDVERIVSTAVHTYGRLDILYNNAAIVHKPASTVDVTLEDWERTIATNLTGTLLCMKHAIPEMLKVRGGSIINTASIAALEGVPGHGGYSASKGGVLSLTRVAAVEYARDGIRVNCIVPGAVATSMLVEFWGEEGVKSLARQNPNGRLGKMEDVANLALFLASDESSHIIGQTIIIDGGHTVDGCRGWSALDKGLEV